MSGVRCRPNAAAASVGRCAARASGWGNALTCPNPKNADPEVVSRFNFHNLQSDTIAYQHSQLDSSSSTVDKNVRIISKPIILSICREQTVASGASTPVRNMSSSGKTFIVEHLDPELGPWSELEYITIGKEAKETNASFILSSLPEGFQVPAALVNNSAFTAEHRGVEELYAANKSRVCLLDPAAAKDLSPEDGDDFDAFLFGGILGMS